MKNVFVILVLFFLSFSIYAFSFEKSSENYGLSSQAKCLALNEDVVTMGGCLVGTSTISEVDYCCTDVITLAVQGASFAETTHTIGWALTTSAISSTDDFSAEDVFNQRGTSITFEVDCANLPDNFYLTPFISADDYDYIYDMTDDLIEGYWGTFTDQTFQFGSEQIPFDWFNGSNMRIEIFNQDNYFSTQGGRSDFYIEYAGTQEFPFLNVPTKPVDAPTVVFDVDVDPATVWRVRVVDRSSNNLGGVFRVKFTFSIPFPTIDQYYCTDVGTSILFQPNNGQQISTPQDGSSLCPNAAPIDLEAQPAGGSFSGAGVSNGMFDPAMASIGLNEITYTLNSNCDNPNSASFNIEVLGEDHVNCMASGLEEQALSQIKYYPNPTSGSLFITNNSEKSKLTIINVAGKIVFEKALPASHSNLDLSHLNAGVYQMVFEEDGGRKVEKLMVF